MTNVTALPDDVVNSMITSGVWKPNCPVPLSRLKLLTLNHYNFEGKIKKGQMVALDIVANDVVQIFHKLFELRFPIHRIRLIDHYSGNDHLSMRDNNSSCFNFRTISDTNEISIHSYGLAIDINPLQNPFIEFRDNLEVEVSPKVGRDFLNRANQRPGMLEPVVDIFRSHGFVIWGGKWNNPIDYHHFQVERKFAYHAAES